MKPIDKAICGMVSESSGRNASEPIGGPVSLQFRWPRPLAPVEGSIDPGKLTDARVYIDGVVGVAR
jgi:hypothetical protein